MRVKCLISGTGSVITKVYLDVQSVHSQFGKIKWEIIVDAKRYSKLPGSKQCFFSMSFLSKLKNKVFRCRGRKENVWIEGSS